MKKSTYVFSKITDENVIVLGKESQKRKRKFNRHDFSSFEIIAIDIGNQRKFNAYRWK